MTSLTVTARINDPSKGSSSPARSGRPSASTRRRLPALLAIAATGLTAMSSTTFAQRVTRREASEALKQAVRYMHDTVATDGGYLWSYSPDLQNRWGEEPATAQQIWVQPPGTPAVGEALIRAYLRTNDRFYLEAARDAAHALAWGQMDSGGWWYLIDFDPNQYKNWRYRRRVQQEGPNISAVRTETTFDDDVTQSALRFLMRFDKASGFSDPVVRSAVEYALDHFIAAQYPNGGWPQFYTEPYNPANYPVIPASYPDSYPRKQPPGHNWRSMYTLNDGASTDAIATMLLAYEIYGDTRYRDAAYKGGDFLLLAQMPSPQRGWAQQYNAQMQPDWARPFEPPALSSAESKLVIRALMNLYVVSGLTKYRNAIPAALDWLEASELPDGKHARYYELETNKPLFLDADYRLTYDDSHTPVVYTWYLNIKVDSLRLDFQNLEQRRRKVLRRKSLFESADEALPVSVLPDLRRTIDGLDGAGRWISDGKITTTTFIHNIDLLSHYVAKGARLPRR